MECRHFSLNGNMQTAAGRGHQGIPRLDWGQGPGARQAACAHASSHLPLTRQTPPNMLANHCPLPTRNVRGSDDGGRPLKAVHCPSWWADKNPASPRTSGLAAPSARAEGAARNDCSPSAGRRGGKAGGQARMSSNPKQRGDRRPGTHQVTCLSVSARLIPCGAASCRCRLRNQRGVTSRLGGLPWQTVTGIPGPRPDSSGFREQHRVQIIRSWK